MLLKGAGGGPDLVMVKNEFMCVYDEGHEGLPDAFYLIKKYCSWPELSQFQIWNLHTITLRSHALIANISKLVFFQFQNPKAPTIFNLGP